MKNTTYTFAKAYTQLTEIERAIIDALVIGRFDGNSKDFARKIDRQNASVYLAIKRMEDAGIVKSDKVLVSKRYRLNGFALADNWEDGVVEITQRLHGAPHEANTNHNGICNESVERSRQIIPNYERKTYDMWAIERKIHGRWCHVSYYVTYAEAKEFARVTDRVVKRRVAKAAAK